MSFANVLTSSATAALNTYISPRYSVRAANEARAPGQPTPPAFGIWFPIFAGNIGYGLLPADEQSSEASLWNHAIALAGGAYAWALVRSRFYSMGAAMAAMTFASVMYRRALPSAASPGGRAVRFASELGIGWLAAADSVVVAQNTRRVLGRPYTHREQDSVGVLEAAAVTGAALAANHILSWKGVSVACAWALGAIALDSRSEKHVRMIAGAAAACVVADLARSVMSTVTAQKTGDALGTDFEDIEELIVLEEAFIPPNLYVEEITTVRI
jgi:hypothetical protein